MSVAFAFVALMAVVPAASANYVNNFNISGSVSGGGGGESSGELTFLAFPGSTKKFRVNGEINDLCPADGRGMELQIRIKMTNGNFFNRGNVMQDLRGCQFAPVVYSQPVTYTAPNPIQKGMARLFATENGAPLFKIAASTWKDHPET